jgi:dihydroxyacid dehydratase/phosphogluconate dehydratase
MILGKAVKEAVQKQGMIAWQYSTIGVSDGITMGNEGTASLPSSILRVTNHLTIVSYFQE